MKTYFNTKTFDALIEQHGFEITAEPEQATLAVLGAKTINWSQFSNLKAVYRFGVGDENVDYAYLKAYAIPVYFPSDRAKEILFDSTANFTVYGIFHLVYAGAFGNVDTWTKGQYAHIRNKVALVIGLGHVGKRVAEKLAPFMSVTTYDVLYNKPEELEPLLRAADVITIHVPLLPQTKNLFNKETLTWVKNDAILINTARGDLYDEEALYEKLSNTNCRAFFDVFWKEPYEGKLKTLGKEKFFMTPHSASNTLAYIEAGFQDILAIAKKYAI